MQPMMIDQKKQTIMCGESMAININPQSYIVATPLSHAFDEGFMHFLFFFY